MSLGLAKRLVTGKTKRERLRTLAAADTTPVEIARSLRDLCYSAWTSDPGSVKKVCAAVTVLADMHEDLEIRAIKAWIEGIAAITRADLEIAVTKLEASSNTFKRLGLEHESARPLVAELIALAMLGRHNDAVRTGKRALRIFQKFGDELAAGKIELNLSNVVSRREKHREAERYCRSARERFRAIGDTEWQTLAENSLANTYAELNDLRKAERTYTDALRNAKAAAMHVTEAEIEASLGNLELLRGNYAKALRLFESSRTTYESLAMPHQKAVAELEIADTYLELNLNTEALEIYKAVSATLRHLKLNAEEARSRANFGRAAIRLGKFSAAKKQLERAAALYVKEGNAMARASVMLEVALIEKRSGNIPAAEALTMKARAILAKSENPRRALPADRLRADLIRERSAKKAKIAFEELSQRSLQLKSFGYYQSALTAHAELELAAGNTKAAKGLYEKAAASIETMRSPLPAEEFRIAFLSDRLEPFQQLMKLAIAECRFADAFVWLERFRARALSDSMNLAGADGNGGRFGKEIAALREELNWHYKRTNAADTANSERSSRAVIRLEKRIAELLRRAKSSSSAGSHFRNSRFLKKDLHALQKKLGVKKALIEYVEVDGQLSAFVVTDRDVKFCDGLISSAEVGSLSRSLRSQFAPLRHTGFGTSALLGSLEARTDQVLGRLHDKLIAPISALIADRDLVIIPAGPLHSVPLHALLSDGKYLIEQRNVIYSPSAAVWQRLASGPKPKFANALLLGYADEKIPMVHSEVERISKLVARANVLKGEQATVRGYLDGASEYDVVHLACHGVFRTDNPMFSSLHFADGWMTANDVASHRINASLVTLSACETGLAEMAAGDEILGLTRGFLSAGARNVVQSLWTVNDYATAELMTHFYAEIQRGRSIAASLRNAQTAMIGRGDHPYHWAPFFLIGG